MPVHGSLYESKEENFNQMVQNFENKMLMEFLVSSRQVSIRKITQLESDEIFC